MKKIFVLGMVLMMALSTFGSAAFSPALAACVTTPQVVTLYAGQHIDVGTVTVDNDANNLYVTFTTSGDWWLQKTHLHVADSLAGIPTNKQGNPKIGNFAYQTTHDPRVQSYTYTIPKSALSLDANGSLVIAAHAEVVKIVDGEVVQSETGWGDGETFVDRGSWATYFSYIWQDCDGGSKSDTETAFARLLLGTNQRGDDQVTCFMDLDTNGNNASRNEGDTDEISRWGWTNGALPEGNYDFELWAGAADCDTTDGDGNPPKGTLVGTLTVVYANGTATVTFNTSGINPDTNLPYTMVATHLYVGNEILARDQNGVYTVAPGKLGHIHDEPTALDSLTRDSYTITGLSGDIYIVAHAVVAGFPVVAP